MLFEPVKDPTTMDVPTSLNASINPTRPHCLRRAGGLDGDARQAHAYKIITEELHSMLHEAPLHGAGHLFESYTPAATASRRRGELSIDWMWLMLENVELGCYSCFYGACMSYRLSKV